MSKRAARSAASCPDCPFPRVAMIPNKDVCEWLGISSAALNMRKRRARIRRDGRRAMRLAGVCRICTSPPKLRPKRPA